MDLVIVESPTKARKLSSYLGKDFKIEASVGHIRDLPKSGLSIDTENNFEPTYEVSSDKTKVITSLTKLAKDADKIYLATDPDREGEAIAWHIKEVLESKKGIGKKSFLRATFHEITKTAVLDAIKNPGEIKMDLVDAQQARRIVDRLVGYEASPVLWKKIRRGLSAGRVQSVALRLIVEREREIEAFVPEEYWEVDVALSTDGKMDLQAFIEGTAREDLPASVLVARVTKTNGKLFKPTQESDVADLRSLLPTANYQVAMVERKKRKRSSLPPFTTSTLQQRAATTLGYSSKQTMRLAQQLYEEGLITYHRTDSVNLSQAAVGMAREHILKTYGQRYLPEKPRYFASKSKNAQEAHEAIRVTDAKVDSANIVQKSSKLTSQHTRLYDLIYRRFVASQMETAVYDQTTVLIDAKPQVDAKPQEPSETKSAKTTTATIASAQLKSSGSILTFDGWMKLFPHSEDTILPEVSNNQGLDFVDQNYAQKFTQPPSRYNDASLIKTLEQLGIGRPSTYASIISVIEDRGYVEREQKRFIATPVGMTVTDFLLEYFGVFMDYAFTAEMEENLDRIARGEKQWRKIVSDFYKPFHKKIEAVTEKAERKQIPVESTGEKCPECGDSDGGEIVIRTGRFGKFKSCSRFPDCKYTENITIKVDGVKCPLCGKGDVIVKNSRWGKQFYGCSTYPKCDWASWKAPKAGDTVTKEEWAKMQEARAERKKKWQESHSKKSGAKSKPAAKAKKSRVSKKTKA